MRKILLLILMITLLLSLASCKNGENGVGDEASNGNNNTQNTITDDVLGLKYELTTDGRYYTVVGTGALAEGADLYIPDAYNGKAIKSIAIGAFSGNTAIKTLTLAEGIEKIGSTAFLGCVNLEAVKLPKTLEKIDSSAFEGCSELKTLVFGKGVTDIGKNAFLGCDGIVSLYYEGTPSDFSKITGTTWCELKYETRYTYSQSYPSASGYYWCWSESGEPLVWEDYIGTSGLRFELSADGTYYKLTGIPSSEAKSIVIPKAHKGLAVKEIDAMAFIGAEMREITIPETITKISGSAFKWCNFLESVTLPHGIEYVGESAFEGCTALKTVNLSESIKEISDKAFVGCTALTSVVIPGTVTKIGADAFEDDVKIYYCSDSDAWSNVNVADVDMNVYFYSEEEPLLDGRFWKYGEDGNTVIW